jgi:hypothetical protein
MAFRLGTSTKISKAHSENDADRGANDRDATEPQDQPQLQVGPLAMEQPLWPPTVPEPHEIDRLFAQVFALVGEGIAGATHALLTGDRDAA